MAGFNFGNLLGSIGSMAKSALPGLGGMIQQHLPGLGGMLGNMLGGEQGAALGKSLGGLGGGMMGGALNPQGNTPWWQSALHGAAQNFAPAMQGLGSMFGGSAQNLANQVGQMGDSMYNSYQQAPSFQHFAQQLPSQMGQYMPGLGHGIGSMFGQGQMGQNAGQAGQSLANMGQGMFNSYQQAPSFQHFVQQLPQQFGDHLPQLRQSIGSMFGQGQGQGQRQMQ